MTIENDSLNATTATVTTAQVVSAYVSSHSVAVADLPALIASVHGAFAATLAPKSDQENAVAARGEPAVPVEKSIGDDFIICLEDGAKMKSLKRYLRTKFNMTPEEYRARWGLPADYPMVCPEYSRRRSEMAKATGLGRNRAPIAA